MHDILCYVSKRSSTVSERKFHIVKRLPFNVVERKVHRKIPRLSAIHIYPEQGTTSTSSESERKMIFLDTASSKPFLDVYPLPLKFPIVSSKWRANNGNKSNASKCLRKRSWKKRESFKELSEKIELNRILNDFLFFLFPFDDVLLLA